MTSEYDFAKRKRPIVQIGGSSNGSVRPTPTETNQKPKASTNQTDYFKKIHSGSKGGQGKPGN